MHVHPQKINRCGHRNETLLRVSIDITRASCLCCLRRRSTYCWQSADKAKLICKSLFERIGGRYVRYTIANKRYCIIERRWWWMHARRKTRKHIASSSARREIGKNCSSRCCQAFLTRIRFRDSSCYISTNPTLSLPRILLFSYNDSFPIHFGSPLHIHEGRYERRVHRTTFVV